MGWRLIDADCKNIIVPAIHHVISLSTSWLVSEELIFQTVEHALEQPSKYDYHWQVKKDELESTDDVD